MAPTAQLIDSAPSKPWVAWFSAIAVPVSVLGMAVKLEMAPGIGELALDPVRLGLALALLCAAGIRRSIGITGQSAAFGALCVAATMLQERTQSLGILPLCVAFAAFAALVASVAFGKPSASKLAGIAACLVFAPYF